MIVQNVFNIKYGKIKDAILIWREITGYLMKIEETRNVRILSDITGPAYTMVVEFEMHDLMQLGFVTYQWGHNEKVSELYKKFIELCLSSATTFYEIEA